MLPVLRRLRAHPALSPLFTPRSFLIFGIQTPLQFVLNTVKLALFGHVFWEHLYSISECGGASMLPTLNVYGDQLLISKLQASGKGVKVGDLVSFVHPMEPDVTVLKRVIGMPGDFVVVDPVGQKGPGMRNMMMAQVPEGHCWVAGDNLAHSIDSRHYGPVPLGLVVGKAIARVLLKPRLFTNNGLKLVEEAKGNSEMGMR